MEKSFFFNSKTVNGQPDRTYSAEDIAQREACIISDGILHGDSLKVVAYSSSYVGVNSGAASIKGYTYYNSASLALNIDRGDSTYDRIDTVVLRLDVSDRSIKAAVVKGTPSATPVAATLAGTNTLKEIPLAEVLVTANSTPVIQSHHITDRRVLANVGHTKDDLLLVIREYIGQIDPVKSSEISALRNIISIISDNKGKDTVLCGDGKYREIPLSTRELCAEWDIPGEYIFFLEDAPSEDDVYDIEIQGGGGGGGAYNGITRRGGGGGAGAFLTLNHVKMLRDMIHLRVGSGGSGGMGTSGEDGEASYFDGYYAEGGHGGGGGISSDGGSGGVSVYRGGDGNSGEPMDGSELYPSCGKGGDSRYGDGAETKYGKIATNGNHATNYGAGGSGASCTAGAYDKKGGNGCSGIVRLYRYVKKSDGEAIG